MNRVHIEDALEVVPRIILKLLDAKAEPPVVFVNIQDLYL
jgi:hypothetical protein